MTASPSRCHSAHSEAEPRHLKARNSNHPDCRHFPDSWNNTADSRRNEGSDEVHVERGAAGGELAQCRDSLADAVDAATLARCEADLATAAANAADLEISLAQSSALRAQLDEVSEELQSCREMARLGFVLVIMSWSTNDDVDLHVVDPAGREFYFAERSFPGSDAAFEEDNINGPGNEVWLHSAAEPGSYRVCYKLYTRRSLPRPEVRGSVLWQEGSIEIPRVDLAREDEVRLAVNVVVDADGNVALDRSQSGLVLNRELCG